MTRRLQRFWQRSRSAWSRPRLPALDPDDMLLDSENVSQMNVERLEGTLERPLTPRTFWVVGAALLLLLLVFLGQAANLQIAHGEQYRTRSEQNHLRHTLIFADRGIIEDRRGERLAWNEVGNQEFPDRRFTPLSGFGHLLGHVSYPSKDSNGYFFSFAVEGKAGAEKEFNAELSGLNGTKITETNALGGVESESVMEPPRAGATLTLSVDARVQHALFGYIKTLAEQIPFEGGAGAIMDVHTGELIALTSYPEYDPAALSGATSSAVISGYQQDVRGPFLNRAIGGLYAPGSIVKPFLAIGALQEGVITPEKEILSTGAISIPNPYNPDNETVFRDWRAHGYTDMRHAIAVSSDVYFYEIGGGYKSQPGLGISRIDQYMNLFGFGRATGIDIEAEQEGVIPDPTWKEVHFPDDPTWRIGDTYHTAIGQYGVQVTPLQAVRAVAAIANRGSLLTPTILERPAALRVPAERLPFTDQEWQVIHEGMRLAVREGTAVGLNTPKVAIAAKTGTAELGAAKKYVNSWVIGYFPYDKPRYAFAVMMERGPRGNTLGATYVMRQLIEWMSTYSPEYLKGESAEPLEKKPDQNAPETSSPRVPVFEGVDGSAVNEIPTGQ